MKGADAERSRRGPALKPPETKQREGYVEGFVERKLALIRGKEVLEKYPHRPSQANGVRCGED